MKEDIWVLINYRIERAHESLEEAKILLERGYANTFVNRLYYACFYAVSALMLTKDLSSAKHSGVKALFQQHFLRPGIIPVEAGQFYEKLFRNRQRGDYVDFVRFNIDEVGPWYDKVKMFIETVEDFIKKGSW